MQVQSPSSYQSKGVFLFGMLEEKSIVGSTSIDQADSCERGVGASGEKAAGCFNTPQTCPSVFQFIDTPQTCPSVFQFIDTPKTCPSVLQFIDL